MLNKKGRSLTKLNLENKITIIDRQLNTLQNFPQTNHHQKKTITSLTALRQELVQQLTLVKDQKILSVRSQTVSFFFTQDTTQAQEKKISHSPKKPG